MYQPYSTTHFEMLMRDDAEHDEREDAHGDENDHDRVDHGPLHLAFERFAPFEKLGQAAENDFQRTARLARLDHVDIQAGEDLGAFGHRFAERRPAFDLIADIHQGVFQAARLLLHFENAEAAENRQAGVLKDRELLGE
jgi:hypothetical protein